MKLTYFNAKGLSEQIRYLLALGDVEYEDNRIEREQWAELKPNTPLGVVPVLEVDGVEYSQSVAIARFAASKAGLRGSSDIEQLATDMIVDTLRGEAGRLLGGIYYSKFMTPDAEKLKAAEAELVEKLPEILKNLEKLVKGEKTFLASGLSWADVILFNIWEDGFKVIGVDALIDLSVYTKLAAVAANVGEQPKIQAWIAKRPQTQG